MLMRPWMGPCAETRDRLSDHLDGELELAKHRRVSRQLRHCRRGACAAAHRFGCLVRAGLLGGVAFAVGRQ